MHQLLIQDMAAWPGLSLLPISDVAKNGTRGVRGRRESGQPSLGRHSEVAGGQEGVQQGEHPAQAAQEGYKRAGRAATLLL